MILRRRATGVKGAPADSVVYGFAMRFAFALALCASLGSSGAVAAEGVKWADGSLDGALARARAERKWVLVDVAASWCGPCHEMDEKVYSRAEVAAAFGEWVPLKRDGEVGDGAAIVERYHVVGYPTLLVLSADGEEVDRVMGFVEAKELLGRLADFRNGRGTLAELEKRAATSHDPALAAELAKRHALRGDGRAVAETEKVVAADLDGSAGRAPEALLVLGKYYWLRGRKDHAQAARTLERLAQLFPSSKAARDEAPYNLAIAYHGLGDDARALKTLDAWLDGGAERYNAYAWCCFKNGFGRARAIAVAREGLAKHPDADALWDSLAELLAQDGHADEAVAAERKALAAKPNDRYYASQLARFGGRR